MTATYRHVGETVDYTPVVGAIDAGEVVVQGTLVGVAARDIAAGAKGALTVEGVFDFPKSVGSAEELTAGAKVYWDSGNEVMTTTSGDNTYAGKVVEAASDSDTTVRVRLEQ